MPTTSSQNKSLINVEKLSKHFKVLNKDGGFKGALKALFSRDYKRVEAVREIILSINKERNTTVLITSHDLNDIEEIARRLMLIDKGDLLYDYEGVVCL